MISCHIYGKTGRGEKALNCFAGFTEESIIVVLGASSK
jgi:hypothetical protein